MTSNDEMTMTEKTKTKNVHTMGSLSGEKTMSKYAHVERRIALQRAKLLETLAAAHTHTNTDANREIESKKSQSKYIGNIVKNAKKKQHTKVKSKKEKMTEIRVCYDRYNK